MMNKQTSSWKNLFYIFIFFAYFSCALQLFLFVSKHSMFGGLRDAIIYSSLWLIPILLLPTQARKISLVLGIILWGASLVSIGYFTIYGQEFSQSVFFVMSESNWNETSEYLQQYFSLKIVAVFVVYTIGAVFLWFRIQPVSLKRSSRWTTIAIILTISIFIPVINCTFIKHETTKGTIQYLTRKTETTVPWQLMVSYSEYQQQLGVMQSLLSKYDAMPPVSNFKDSSGEAPRTLVLVIGESTTRTRMSLYGYQRQTTPLLDELSKNDKNFIKFNDVISSRPYTIEILEQALTFADEQNPDLYLDQPSLIHIMKQAGYKTFWITNQQTMTKRNTMLTMFSQQTDEQFYLNNDRSQNSRQYDEVVFEPFKQVLNDPSEKKFIIIHLLGTHMNYRYRFPESFNVFTDDSNIPIPLSADKLTDYNNYDNAERYNDFVVSSLMNIFNKSHQNGFLLYFSDHGEDVYESAPHDFLGRNEKAPTVPMYTVPFLLYVSPQWQEQSKMIQQNNYHDYIDRQYSTANFIHTWSDLAGLSYDLYEPSKSIINPEFSKTTRWIGDPYAKNGLKDFDELFKKQ